MNCDQFQNAFDQAVESRSAISPGLLAHAETCRSQACRDRLIEHRLLEAVLTNWKCRLPDVSMTDAIVAELTQDDRVNADVSVSNRSQLGNQAASALAVLTACLAIGLIGLFSLNSTRTSRRMELVDQRAGTVGPNTLESNSEEEFDLSAMTEYGLSYGEWVQGTASKLTGTMSVVLLEGEDEALESTTDWFTMLSQRLEALDKDFDKTLKLVVPMQTEEMNDQTVRPNQVDGGLI